MKKLVVSMIITALCSTVAWAGNTNYNAPSAKYELGQYNFDFSGGKTEETVKVKNTEPILQETAKNPQPQKKEIKNNLNTQKDIINQVKKEEAVKIKQNTEKEIIQKTDKKEKVKEIKTEKTKENPEKEIKLEINQDKKIEKRLNKEPKYNNPTKTKKTDEKKIHNKKNSKTQDMLFDFKIMDVQIIPEESRTIERL